MTLSKTKKIRYYVMEDGVYKQVCKLYYDIVQRRKQFVVLVQQLPDEIFGLVRTYFDVNYCDMERYRHYKKMETWFKIPRKNRWWLEHLHVFENVGNQILRQEQRPHLQIYKIDRNKERILESYKTVISCEIDCTHHERHKPNSTKFVEKQVENTVNFYKQKQELLFYKNIIRQIKVQDEPYTMYSLLGRPYTKLKLNSASEMYDSAMKWHCHMKRDAEPICIKLQIVKTIENTRLTQDIKWNGCGTVPYNEEMWCLM